MKGGNICRKSMRVAVFAEHIDIVSKATRCACWFVTAGFVNGVPAPRAASESWSIFISMTKKLLFIQLI